MPLNPSPKTTTATKTSSARARALVKTGGIKKRPAVDEDALALEIGKKLLAHFRRDGGLKLHVWKTDDGAQANLGYMSESAWTCHTAPHPLLAMQRVFDLRTPGFHKAEPPRLVPKKPSR